MATTIVTKNSSTASAVPTAAQLVQGELAVNVADKRIFTENNVGGVVELGTNPSSLTVSGNIDVDGTANLDAVDIDGAVDMASTLTVAGEITANGGIALGDNDKATFGAGDDLQIYHDGSHSWIKDAGAGNMYISSDGYAVNFVKGDNAATVAQFIPDGPVNLYNAGALKLATTSTGIEVTGTATMDGLTVDASASGVAKISGADQAYARLTIDNLNGQAWNLIAGTAGASNSGFGIYDGDAGATRLQIDSSGRVGIGTDAPDAILHTAKTVNSGDVPNILENSGTSGTCTSSLVFSGNGGGGAEKARIKAAVYGDGYMAFHTNNDTEKMRIDASGNVGIGTTSPDAPLTLNGSSSSRLNMRAGDTRYGTLFADSGVFAVSSIGSTPLVLGTNDTERMRIDSSGNVGIGTSSPSGKTHSVAADAQVAVMAGGDVSDPLYPAFGFDGQIGSNGGRGAGMYLPSDSTLAWSTAGTERMRIDSSGNVGIGTDSPADKLNISGGGILVNTTSAGGVAVSTSLENGTAQFKTLNSNLATPAEQFYVGNNLGDVDLGNKRGALKFFTGTTEAMRIDSSGNLLVGCTALDQQRGFAVEEGPATNVQIMHNFGEASGTTYAQFLYATSAIGSISQSGTTAVLYNTSSDQRLKENIADADDAGSKVDAIQVRKYDWKADGSHQDYGMIAQELMTVAPEAVSGDPDSEEMMGVDYSKLVPMLIKEIQSLRNRVAQLEE